MKKLALIFTVTAGVCLSSNAFAIEEIEEGISPISQVVVIDSNHNGKIDVGDHALMHTTYTHSKTGGLWSDNVIKEHVAFNKVELNKADTNRDGFLDVAEIKAAGIYAHTIKSNQHNVVLIDNDERPIVSKIELSSEKVLLEGQENSFPLIEEE